MGGGIIRTIILGNYGPGSYYYGIMFQFVFLVPIVKEIVKRYTENGLIVLFVINLVYELICRTIDLDVTYYRILAFRYLFIISIGVYIFFIREIRKSRIPNSILVVGICIGVIFLGLSYTGYNYKIFTYPVWWRTSMLVGCYIGPVCYIIIDRFFDFSIKNFLGNCISEIGKATYHILYAQMLFYVVYYDIGNDYFVTGTYGKFCFLIATCCMLIVGVAWNKASGLF